jgi:hypothetical protein
MQCFFYISTPGFQKWTFINVQFQKSRFRFEKNNHHHFFGSALPIPRGYLYALVGVVMVQARGDHNAAKYKK